jgi:hypothetical protein
MIMDKGGTIAQDIMMAVEIKEYKQLKSDVKKMRELLWIYHGHFQELYGDDGERQCSRCVIDFKRDTVDEICQKIAQQTSIPK